MARRELDAEHRQHAVEGLVLERKLLGVALDPIDRDGVLVGAPAGCLEQLGREIEADDPRAGVRRGIAALPVPVATSSTSWPGLRSMWASRSRGGAASISSATAA